MALDGPGHADGADLELRAWIKSLAARPAPRAQGESRSFSKAALQEIGASEPDLAD